MMLTRRTVAVQRALRTTLMAAACAVMAGCGLPRDDWSGARQAPQPYAKVAIFQHTIQFEPGSAWMRTSGQHRWEAFLQKVRRENADTILLSVGPAQSRGGQMTQALLRLRQQEIVSVLRKGGVPVEAIHLGAAEAPVDGAVMVVRAHVRALPECPDWSADPRRGYNNQPSSNWGCATAISFGVMLADSRDLIRGKALRTYPGRALRQVMRPSAKWSMAR